MGRSDDEARGQNGDGKNGRLSWEGPRPRPTREQDVAMLVRAIEVSRRSREHGNTPFGALLAGPDGEVLMEQENVEITEHRCTGHAETSLAERASGVYDKPFLWRCTLYTTFEPCVMCAGSIYWANIGRVVYGLTEESLLAVTGDDEQNPTCSLPCREVFSHTQKDVEVVGPFPELEEQVLAVHEGYWG